MLPRTSPSASSRPPNFRAASALPLPTFLALLSSALLLACGGGESARNASDASAGDSGLSGAGSRFSGELPIRVVATVGMVADLARQIGGDRVAVKALMGEGVDPHLYKASPGDLSRLRSADLILYAGLHLEGKMADVLVKLARTTPVFAVGEAIPEERLREPPEMEGAWDPHVWFDASLWRECAAFTRDVLVEFDPAGAEVYRARGEEFLARLDALHESTKARIAEIPPERRLLVTAHDAFGYFGDAYGIEVVAIQGISTESEAGVRRVNELVDLLVRRGVGAVFVESSVSEKNIHALIEGCAARGHAVKIGGSLFSDAMGADGTPEGTYEGMVRHNVDRIVEALR